MSSPTRLRRLLAPALLVLLGAQALPAADLPRISYSKAFPKSTPAFVAITVAKDGNSEYRESLEEEPLRFQLTAKETGELFALADKLDRFKRPLESKLKVANTGIKTFRWESGAEKHEVQFNFSQDVDARVLWDWFERITESERHRINLERSARFDKLGINDALLQLEVSHDRARLVAPAQFLPILDRIIKNQSFLHMARARASKLADAFRAGADGTTE
ncbi:MAG TPA: hypothetical protein VN428_23540 [Bryobacteraceae bacterium]|nr:hypothetical protein [Bryobacteraceae bacterium]